MPCFFPRPYAVLGTNPSTGKKIIKLLNGHVVPGAENAIACRQCTGCRLERSRQWAVRCVHEMKQHKTNCFLTLTYRPDALPQNGSLKKRDIQLFMKRLRKKFGQGIRYYYCGEYGEQLKRPHYHIILFGHDFADRYEPHKTESGELVWRSHELEKLWTYGFSSVGEATFESAAYVARYIMKKQLGKTGVSHYNGLTPEFTDMSRRPGIGKTWWDQNKNVTAATDQVIMRGKAFKPPEYYDKQFDKHAPEQMADIRRKRQNKKNTKNKYLKEKYKTAKEMAQAIKERKNAAKHAALTLRQKTKRNYESEN